MAVVTMKQLLDSGTHFGHQTRRWNPKMAPYIYGVHNGIHIMDLQQTAPMLHRAMTLVRDTVASGGRVLFVGTKRQASERIAEAAKRCGQYYVNHRWLGGMLTNWQTVSKSIRRLRELDDLFTGETLGLTKKELLKFIKVKFNKLEIKKVESLKKFDLKSSNLRVYYHKNILAFGDELHRIHPLAGQGFNMVIRDIKLLIDLITTKKNLGLKLDSSICVDFEKKIKSPNFLFSSGIDFIYEFFKFESKINNNLLSKSIQFFGKNKSMTKFLTRVADKGIII